MQVGLQGRVDAGYLMPSDTREIPLLIDPKLTGPQRKRRSVDVAKPGVTPRQTWSLVHGSMASEVRGFSGFVEGDPAQVEGLAGGAAVGRDR